jgi:hypothetical protein
MKKYAPPRMYDVRGQLLYGTVAGCFPASALSYFQEEQQEQTKVKNEDKNELLDRRDTNFAARLVLPLLPFVEMNPPSGEELPEKNDTFPHMLRSDKKGVDTEVPQAYVEEADEVNEEETSRIGVEFHMHLYQGG